MPQAFGSTGTTVTAQPVCTELVIGNRHLKKNVCVCMHVEAREQIPLLEKLAVPQESACVTPGLFCEGDTAQVLCKG